jgi:hypothetical protein
LGKEEYQVTGILDINDNETQVSVCANLKEKTTNFKGKSKFVFEKIDGCLTVKATESFITDENGKIVYFLDIPSLATCLSPLTINKETGAVAAGFSYQKTKNGDDPDFRGTLALNLTPMCTPCEDFAIKVLDFQQGTRGDGQGKVAKSRSHANHALGAPQNDDQQSSPINYVSLGFGGVVELELATPARNWNKKGIAVVPTYAKYQGEISYGDLIVVETSYGRSGTNCGYPDLLAERYPEKAQFYGRESQEKPWVYLGEGCRTSFVDVANIEKAGQQYVKYLKIEDVSDKQWFTRLDDGYDVDGVLVCQQVVAAILQTGKYEGNKIAQGRKEGGFRFSLDYFNREPNVTQDLQEEQWKVYPNPSQGKVAVSFFSEAKKNVRLQLYDAQGKLLIDRYWQVQQGANQVELDLSAFSKGLYVLQTSSEQHVYSMSKIIKE